MENEFGNTGDQSGGEPTSFDGDDKTKTVTAEIGITAEELAALKTRDTSAQSHIVDIESENEALRTQVTELSNNLASATTLEEVMSRMKTDDGTSHEQVDPDKVAEKVEQRLQLRTQQRVSDDNWTAVYDKLTDVYGEWDKANQEIEMRCTKLNMTTQEATSLAKTSPAAFYELFLPKQGTPTQSSAASATGKQTSMPPVEEGSTRDRAYYKELRKKNPNKYWSPEVQAQYRRDIHGAQ